MKNKVVLSVGWLLGILSLAACGNETGGVLQEEYVPFQTEKDGRWGLVSPDGEILYEEEFENRPTSVVNGRFMVEDGDGKWEIYVPEKPARKVGGKYVSATQFGPGSVALVTRGKNKGIEMIDKEGNVRCVLNEVVGKPVDRAYYLVFVRGGASFFTPWVVFETGGKQGCMDSEGNITVKPEYDGFLCSGKYLMAIKGGKSLDANGVPVWWTVDEGDTLQTCILDDRGKQLRSFSVFGESAVGFSDDVIYVGKVDTGNEVQEYELRTMDNDVLLKLPQNIVPIPYTCLSEDNFVFVDVESEKCGLMDMSGIVLIRDKYDDLRSVSDNLFMAARDGKAHLVDVKDNPVGNVEFRRWFLGKRKLLVEEEENSWCFIDYAGQKTGDKSFYNMESNAYLSVESDYVDLMGLLHSLDIKDDGIGGYTLGMTAKECVEKTDEEVGYDGETYITTRLDLKTCKADVTVAFPEAIHQIKKWKDGYRYHTAFLLTEPRPDYVRLVIRNEKKLNDKGDMLFETMKSYMKAFGKRLIREDKDVQVYDQGGGIAMTVLKNRKEDGVLVIYIGAADRSFDRVDEEAPSYMEDSVVVVEEVIEVDSVIADSAVAW